MPQADGIELSPFLARSVRAASILLPLVLLPGAVASQEVTTCTGAPGTVTVLKNQPYALCALATSYQYNVITYAKCDALFGNSISLQQRFSVPGGASGSISDINAGQPKRGGYI